MVFYCCIIDAICSLPMFFLSYAEGEGWLNAKQQLGLAILNIGYAAVSVIIYGGFKLLLQTFMKRTGFHLFFDALIAFSIITPILMFAKIYSPSFKHTIDLFFMVVSIPSYIAFSFVFFRLRTCQDAFGSLWKNLCLVNVWTGICFLSVVLIPLAIVLNVISSIMSAKVFLAASKIEE